MPSTSTPTSADPRARPSVNATTTRSKRSASRSASTSRARAASSTWILHPRGRLPEEGLGAARPDPLRRDTLLRGPRPRAGDKNLARAVGAANGQNPLSIVVPCHRVVGADGSLTGYAGGLERKRFLLALEESDEARASRLF
ncbi:MGMT family protein [Oerskovia sp. M15]